MSRVERKSSRKKPKVKGADRLKPGVVTVLVACAAALPMSSPLTVARAEDGLSSRVAKSVPNPFSRELEEMERKLGELSLSLESVTDEMDFQAGNLAAAFPDSIEAQQSFLREMRISSQRFNDALSQIREEAITALAPETLRLDEMIFMQRRTPSPAIRNALREQRKRLNGAKVRLAETSNRNFQSAVSRLFSLNDTLVFPAKLTGRPSPRVASVVMGAGMLGSTVAGVATAATVDEGAGIGMVIGGGWIGFAGLFALYGVAGEQLEYGNPFIYSSVKDNAGNWIVTSRDRVHVRRVEFQEMLLKAGKQAFSRCETSDCVYLMVEHFVHWSKAVEKSINRDISLIPGVRLEAIDTPSVHASQRALHQMAGMVASQLEPTEFQVNRD